MQKDELLDRLQKADVRFLRLQFTDILGLNKNVEVPISQFERALAGEISFDGSSIEGFTRIEESDMLLKPDLETFAIFPPELGEARPGQIARLICDVTYPDGRPFEGDPRGALKRQIDRLKRLGFEDCLVGPEPEFFLFLRTPEGEPSTLTHDRAGYFDLAPIDRGEEARRDMVEALVAMGFEIEAAHHEVAPGQHEIDFKHTGALKAADNIATFKFVVKRVALRHGLHATFLPKPIAEVNGSGMHTHLSLVKDGSNAFWSRGTSHQLSETALHFIAGLLEHAEAIAAVTNPLVNSYKRLVPGYEAPTNIAWSASNRSALIRVPAPRGPHTRIEFRMPDPSCNPYLALAVMLASGIDGLERKLLPPPPIQRNVYHLSIRERRHHRVRDLPGTLWEALEALQKDAVVRGALGDLIYGHFLHAKQAEWNAYRIAVHRWELDRYLAEY